MRVAIVVEWLDPSRGGAETSTRQFIDHLVARGVSPTVVTRSDPTIPGGVNVHTVSTRARTRVGATAEFMRAAERRVGEAGCDLVHAFTPCVGAQVYQPRGGLVAETILRTAATRRTAVGRAVKRLTLRFNARQRMVLKKERDWLTGDRRPVVIAISNYVARQLRRHYNYPESSIRYVLNGVDVAPVRESDRVCNRARIRDRFSLGEGDVLLLQVCHNFRLKGVGCVIEALSLLRRRGLGGMKTLVVGRGSAGRWKAMADRLKVGDIHHFAGPTDDVDAFYHAADVLVHPTYYDPCSRVVLEAVAHGLPVICSRYDGACEVIDDGISGFVIDAPDRIPTLADRIQRVCDRAVRSAMSEAVEKRGKMCGISMTRHVEQVLSVYDTLGTSRIADGGRPGMVTVSGKRL